MIKTSQKIWSLGVLVVIILAMAAGAMYYISRSRTWQLFGNLYWRVKTNEKVVALTFDDAPTDKTEEILSILQEHEAKATFYMVGQALEQNLDWGREIVAAGQELGNHSYSHQRFIFKSQEEIDQEIQKTNDLIRLVGYEGEITFRPPNGKKLIGLPWYLYRHQIKTVMWDIEPDTKFAGQKDKIVQDVLEKARPGSIILMHPFCGAECAADREALPEVITGLQAGGYRLVTVGELLSYNQ